MTSTFESTRPEDYLVRVARSEPGRSLKAVALDELGVRHGDTVLDLGCGPGADLLAIAAAVGELGHVIGIDHDPVAVASARDVVAGLPHVVVRDGDAHGLDLDDDSVDRVRTDRVLQHVDSPAQVLAEAARVLRPGGLMVLAEPDWDTLIIDSADPQIASDYRAWVVDHVVRHGRIGRELPRLCETAGLRVERVLPVTTVWRNALEADQVLGFARVIARAVDAGQIDSEAARLWLLDLASGPFLASVTLFVVGVSRQSTGSGTPR